jgi:hypothetical protein
MAKKSAALAVTVVLAALLASCATPTPYQPNIPGQSASGGYSDVRIEPNRWRVSFAGNSLTSRETVEGYLLFRAAELTIQQGYDWFSIVDRDTQRKAYTYVEPDPLYHPWYGPSYGAWRPSWRYWGPGYGAWRSWDPYWGDPFWADRVEVRGQRRSLHGQGGQARRRPEGLRRPPGDRQSSAADQISRAEEVGLNHRTRGGPAPPYPAVAPHTDW